MKIYLDVFIMGLVLGWGPCLYFCSPILLPYIAATQKGWLPGFKVSLAFSLARILPYAVLSIISAVVGQFLIVNFYDTGARPIIYLAIGGFITALSIIILAGKNSFLHCCLPFKKTAPEGIKEVVILGLLTGLAPCLPLFGLLAYIAVNAQNILHGLLLGLAFGLGTLISPLILLGSLAGGIARALMSRPLMYKIFSRLCGLILLYWGISMIMAVLRL